MRTRLFLSILIAFAFSAGAFAQLDAEDAVEAVKKTVKIRKYVDASIGYVPSSEYQALKASVSLNNILLKRLGVYTSFEKGLTSGYFSNIIGATASITPWLYLFGGFDWFTPTHGVFYWGNFKEARKEVGVGIFPYNNVLVRLGWSFNAGPTFAVGWKFPLK